MSKKPGAAPHASSVGWAVTWGRDGLVARRGLSSELLLRAGEGRLCAIARHLVVGLPALVRASHQHLARHVTPCHARARGNINDPRTTLATATAPTSTRNSPARPNRRTVAYGPATPAPACSYPPQPPSLRPLPPSSCLAPGTADAARLRTPRAGMRDGSARLAGNDTKIYRRRQGREAGERRGRCGSAARVTGRDLKGCRGDGCAWMVIGSLRAGARSSSLSASASVRTRTRERVSRKSWLRYGITSRSRLRRGRQRDDSPPLRACAAGCSSASILRQEEAEEHQGDTREADLQEGLARAGEGASRPQQGQGAMKAP